MKYFVLIFFILISCNEEKVIENQKGQLKIVATYCKFDYPDHFYSNPSFKLFKKNDEEIILKNDEETLISDIEIGEYYIEYKSIFNKINRVDFTISNDKQKEVELCYDYFNYELNENVLLLDELRNGEVLKLRYESLGCFHNKKEELKVIKEEYAFILEYNDIKYQLTEKQLQLFREFEIELRSNHSGGCSTEDSYGIYNETTRKLYTVKDEGCMWRGFRNLLKLLELK